ncbi:hypothetical protein CC86DRAFT_27981 [Ophiobolus disseminans]|uniref:C2H2-type domain-containing protein n=1 Tax=Ophiobolus disseminans TaxID=1469910 RepID=A0A6A7A0T0_9PLEO|nr:hypothetical protein CC86DRAFT_27981 [Ophiobolus disseminans]
MTASHKHGGLPKLSTSKELPRRDSLSSSRTGDSGYNSDPDVSFSPLDYIDPDQHILFSPLPSKPSFIHTFRAFHHFSPPQRLCITSSPASSRPVHENHFRAAERVCHPKPTASIIGSTDVLFRPGLVEADNNIEEWIKDNLPSHNRPNKRVSSIVSQSSASSCEMYTNTDVSDDEHEDGSLICQPVLPRATIKTIEAIIRRIEVNLRFVAHMQCNGGGTSNATTGTTSMSRQDSRKASQGGSKRKSRSDDQHPPNEDEEDGANKRRRGSLATVESSETGARFACPFFKHEPNRYRNRRTCPGPGWQTVHRMKEHLYRAHTQSIYCPRCYTMFDADVDLSNHLRSAQCHVSVPQPIEGIDRETLKALRKRSPALRLEEDKWRDVYHLLFPDVAMEDIPSPFYDSDSSTEESRRFRRELLRRIQQELTTTAGQLPGAVEQQLLRQVAQIIRRCEDDMLNSFDASTLLVPSLTDRRSSDTSTLSNISTQPGTQVPTPAAERNMGSLPSQEIPPIDTDTLIPTWHNHWQSSFRPPEQPIHLTSVPRDAPPTQTPTSDWIDWDAIFPSAPPDSSCTEPFSAFSVPMWTR